jgi:hypothetical protein
MVHMQVPFFRHSLAPENSKYVAKVLETPLLFQVQSGKGSVKREPNTLGLNNKILFQLNSFENFYSGWRRK